MAKLRPEQLSQDLQKKLRPVYLISGDEMLLVQESCDAIRKAASQAGFSERERHYVGNQTDWSELLIAGSSLSLFNDKKLIEFHTDSDKLGDSGSKAITAYLAKRSEDNILLIVTPKLKAAQQKSKWLQAIIQQGAWVPIWSLEGTQFRYWVSKRLENSHLYADKDTIDILVNRTEGNLLAAAQEIEKLTLLATDGKVSPSLMTDAVGNNARFNVFDLVDKALRGDAQGAAHCLHSLMNEVVEMSIILWGLSREMRSLVTIKEMMENGQTSAKAFSSAGIWDKRKPLIQQAIGRLSRQQLDWLMRCASAVDKAIKGLHDIDVRIALLDLTLNLAGVSAIDMNNQRLSLKP